MIQMYCRALTIVFAITLTAPASAFDIIAHRGASGYLPEHTLASVALAHAQGPDYIEQDVILTRDHVPIVLHDIHLETVTNVESEFPERAREDKRYYAIDFTLAELRTLRIHERQKPSGKAVYPGRFQGEPVNFQIATLREHITLIQQLNRLTGREVGFYTEIKSPAWHRQQGADISRVVLATLAEFGLTQPTASLMLQCFDLAEVKRLRHKLGYRGKLVMLIGDNGWSESATDYKVLRTPAGIKALAPFVDGIGPWIKHLVASDGSPKKPQWLATAQQEGLLVHPFTFRTDALPYGMTSHTLLDALREFGIDGIFTDQVPPVNAYLKNAGSGL